MKRLLIGAVALVLLSGCTVISGDLKEALKAQTHYTRQYVQYMQPRCENLEEMHGVGERLLANCDSIDKLLEE